MDPEFLTWLIAATAGNTLAALAVLLWPRVTVTGRRVLWAAIVVATAALLEMTWLHGFRLSAFGVMNLAWQTLTVTVPVAGLAVLVAQRAGKRVTRASLLIAALAVPALPVGLYAQLVEPKAWRLERATIDVPVERAGSAPITIAVLADLQSTHVERHHREAVAALMAGEPDLVLIPGDLFQGEMFQFEQNVDGFRELLSTMEAPGGVWVVPGNADVPHLVEPTLEGTGARLLRDEQVTLTVRDRTLTIFGYDEIAHEGTSEWRDGERRAERVLRDFLSAPGDDIRLLLAHRPRVVLDLPAESRCDLVVAGHTHGGQVNLPLIGPPIVLSPLPRTIAAGGASEVSGNALYISRGLGLERLQAPRIRLGAPPEVTLITLADAADDGAPRRDGE